MITYTVPKSCSYENLPLLYSNEIEDKTKKNNFLIKSSGQRPTVEWTISNDDHAREIALSDGHDFAELNNCQAIIHIIKASIGTGVLALPSALRYSGLLLGSLGILILSLISIYSMRLLLQVVANIRSTSSKVIRNLDYEKTVQLCFEDAPVKLRRYSWLHHVLLASLAVAQIGFVSSYHIFVAENTKALVENYTTPMSLWIYQLLFFFILAPLLFIKTLDKLSYFTQLANFLVVVSLGISFVYCLQDPIPIGQLDLVKLSDSTPLFFGIVIFSFESINLINPIESHLKKKSSILNVCGVLNLATSLVIVVYLLIGVSGYLKFGDNVASSLILSIPMNPWYNMLCKPFYIVSIIISYALQGYVMFSIIWKKFGEKFRSENSKIFGGVVIRLGIAGTTTLLSIAIPHFDLFISLVGAFSGAAITLIFPAICNSVSVLSHKSRYRWRWKLFMNGFIFAIGVLGCVLGTYSSVVNIVRALRK